MGLLLLASGCATAAPAPPSAPTQAPTVTAPRATPQAQSPAPTPATSTGPSPTPTRVSATPSASQPRSSTERPVKRGGTLSLGSPVSFPHWDPHRSAGDVEMWEYLGDYILNLDPLDGHPVPQLAQSWEFKDPVTLVLHVRQGVKFHNLPPINGRVLTANDIVWNLERMRRPSPQYVWKGNFDAVESITALDQYTIQIKLKFPFAPILTYLKGTTLPTQPVLAREVEEKLGGEDAYKDLSNARATGPFMIKSYTPSVAAVAVRNPDYWQAGKPYVDSVVLLIVPDRATMLAAYRVGKVDYGGSSNSPVDVTTKRNLERTNPNIKFTPAPNFWVISLVPQLAVKPFDDIRLRKAMFLAIDRQEMLTVAEGGGGHISAPMSWRLFPGWTWSEKELLAREGYRPKNTPQGKADLEEAQKIMRELGYGPDKPLVLQAEGSQFGTNLVPMEVAKSQLRKIWIEIPSIKIVDRAQWFDTEVRSEFTFRARSYNAPPEPDGQLYTRHASSGGRNYQKLSDKKLDELFDQQRREIDVAKRKQLVLQSQERLWELYPQIWLYTQEPYFTRQPWVVMEPSAWRRWGDPASVWIDR